MIKRKEIGLIGLGEMGKGMALRLLERNWKVIGYDRDEKTRKELVKKRVNEAVTIEDLVRKLSLPRIVWLMIPAETIKEILFGKEGLINFLEKGDIVIDGGNSFYLNSVKRYKKLAKKGINFIDVGVSGGPRGAREGACLMIGGERKLFEKLKPLFEDLATEKGLQFFAGPGAGHFVKMVHNGIEYGMMQAIAEGFNLMKKSSYNLNLKKVAEIYSHGSVIESRLIGWLKKAFEERGEDLKKISGRVGHTGEGEWTIKVAKKMGMPVRIIEESFKFRVSSQKKPSYTGKILSVLREQFGGHKVTK